MDSLFEVHAARCEANASFYGLERKLQFFFLGIIIGFSWAWVAVNLRVLIWLFALCFVAVYIVYPLLWNRFPSVMPELPDATRKTIVFSERAWMSLNPCISMVYSHVQIQKPILFLLPEEHLPAYLDAIKLFAESKNLLVQTNNMQSFEEPPNTKAPRYINPKQYLGFGKYTLMEVIYFNKPEDSLRT